MNKLIIYTLSLFSLAGCGQAGNQLNRMAINHSFKTKIPEAVLTADHQYWKASKEKPSAILKAKFETDGRFKFFYDEATVTGTVEFAKNKAGRNILITHATNSIGNGRGQRLGEEYLATKYSNTYLWERIRFPGIPSEDFLLLVDLDAYPQAGTGQPGSINKGWVTKFQIRQ